MANEIWIDKYKPETLDNVYGNKVLINTLDNYVKSLKDNSKLNKNILISGPSGIGKTSIAHLVLKKNNYRVIEFNASNIEGNKTVKNVIKNSFFHNNVLEMFNQDKKTTAVIIDEYDALISIGAKTGTSEILSLLKTSHKTKKDKEKIKVPIIFTCKNLNEKKILELKKYCKEFKLKDLTTFEIEQVLNNIIKKEEINFDDDAFKIFCKSQGKDIRNNINNLQYLFKKDIKHITIDNIKKLESTINEKDKDIQLNTGINKIFLSNNIKNSELEDIYHMDTFLIPMIIHENYIHIIINKHRKNYVKHISKISDLLCINDIMNNKTFRNNYWEIINYLPYLSTIPVNKIIKKNNIECKINYSSLFFSKLSQRSIKKNKIVKFIMSFESSRIKYENIFILLDMIKYFINTNKMEDLNNILNYYHFTYEQFNELVKLDKDISTQIKNNQKKIIKKYLNND